MKKLVCMLLLLTMMGCAKNEAVIQEPERPPVQEAVETPEAVEPETPVEPEPEPEEPVIEESSLPDLPYPVYCWGDTAVSKDGTVILQVPEHTLEVCYDAVSGKARGILSYTDDNLWVSNGIYDLQGQPLPIGSSPLDFGCAGDLMWYGGFRNFTVQRLSDGEILAEGVKNVTMLGDQVALLPAYKFDALVLLDSKTGEITLEADQGFQPTFSFNKNGVPAYMAVTAPDGSAQNLIDARGQTLLKDFQYEIYDVQQNCAIVRGFENGSYVRQAIDLDTQEVVFQTEPDSYFDLLPEGAILETEAGWFLVDRQGNRLYDTALDGHVIYDWNQDGDPEYLLATILRDDRYCTVVLKPDGTEIAELPAEQWQDVEPLSPTSLAYKVYTGQGALHQEARFRNLETGQETVLVSGASLWVRQIDTSGGHMIRCEVDGSTLLFLNDGTPARDDLGQCHYLGGDVFSCDEGLRCLDGSWLYRAE